MDFSENIWLERFNGTATSEATELTMGRGISGVDGNQHFVRALLVISVTIASISVVSTLSALYWFVKIRRSFRHEQVPPAQVAGHSLTHARLILLLIQSDFLKSIMFVVFPIVSFGWGPIPSNSAFCQLSGFALAVGIESSDIAVLLIALHSAMYIFRPRSGLYPYRQFAYLVFYLYPILSASLAFIGGDGYENMGHYCYLRTDRSWARLSLSWVPRYIICTSIVVIYVFIYFYIRRKMGDYGRRRSEAMQPQPPRGSVTTYPGHRLRYHGLLSSTPCSRRSSATDTIKDRLRPASLIGRARSGSARTSTEVKWNWRGFTQAQTSGGSRLSVDDTRDPVSPNSPGLLSPPAAHIPRPIPTIDIPPDSLPTNSGNNHPQPHPFPAVHPSISPTTTTTTRPPSPTSPLLALTPTTDPAQAKQHKKTLRQLRSLFIYPLVYIIIWLFPFISHILGHDDSSVATPHNRPPPAWLVIVSLLSLCVQGAADCVVFMARERPWRYAEGRGFLVGLRKRWFGFGFGFGPGSASAVGGSSDGVGRTREEALVDGRLARERREEEVVFEREVLSRREGGGVPGKGRGREWWDVYVEEGGVDGGDDDYEVEEEGQVEVRQEVG
jgi:G protein-coupled receptor GPR1